MATASELRTQIASKEADIKDYEDLIAPLHVDIKDLNVTLESQQAACEHLSIATGEVVDGRIILTCENSDCGMQWVATVSPSG
ncbi:MAG: hypothetical protein DRP01_00270 [Archaeoglobales archaeon]|nr:MAG: hypothetical protein DRP01_00270 [Archaeoglobales archaeon]